MIALVVQYFLCITSIFGKTPNTFVGLLITNKFYINKSIGLFIK
ncbi:hypothetical protein XBJ2_1820026 [Xenorhabdus bovienii str. Jollieti]|nr:hypothetical protein XBJ2_1820026 [Xenorhabdus bovienii str. Jollieti]